MWNNGLELEQCCPEVVSSWQPEVCSPPHSTQETLIACSELYRGLVVYRIVRVYLQSLEIFECHDPNGPQDTWYGEAASYMGTLQTYS